MYPWQFIHFITSFPIPSKTLLKQFKKIQSKLSQARHFLWPVLPGTHKHTKNSHNDTQASY